MNQRTQKMVMTVSIIAAVMATFIFTCGIAKRYFGVPLETSATLITIGSVFGVTLLATLNFANRKE